ncbi:hypothetical protein B0H14DRAFT_2617454 [Mycena olivaceomarginata]|nr:hypothetical protein B0H14DRAFT_2617454 [Mycena olivaceomarginata]
MAKTSRHAKNLGNVLLMAHQQGQSCRGSGSSLTVKIKISPELMGSDPTNRLQTPPTGLFGLGLGFGCRSKPKPADRLGKPVCRLGKPVCSLSRETGLHIFLAPNALFN